MSSGVTVRRKLSGAEPAASVSTSNAPTTFFMASEKDLDASRSTSATNMDGSTYGVRSIEGTSEFGYAASCQPPGEADNTTVGRTRPSPKRRGTARRERSLEKWSQVSATSSASSSQTLLSQPVTPTVFASPNFGSKAPSSPKSTSSKSLQLSDEDDFDESSSQAVLSSGEEEGTEEAHAGTGRSEEEGLQLVMPSIVMPKRRPFTGRGREMGRLKILLAGASGVGKTSLIKSVVQICEDIVHVDQTTSHPSSLASDAARPRRDAISDGLKGIAEVYASTRAYPAWWSDFEEGQLPRRRRSSGETVLERNLCFVDTPGYDSGTSMLEGMEPTLRYVEAQMAKAISTTAMNDGDLLGILSGKGGAQVDVVFYLITPDLRPTDLDFLRHLCRLTNVIILLSKADLLSATDGENLKLAISRELLASEVHPFTFASRHAAITSPYLVCSSPSSELQHMDASLLMSTDYVQPLMPSELSFLMDSIFDKENICSLKHSSAKKLLAWRRSPHTARSASRTIMPPQQSRRSMDQPPPRSLPFLTPVPNTSALSFVNARLADHIQREERLAQVQLASWAINLRRSLANERARYETLVDKERQAWLKQRMDECIFDSRITKLATRATTRHNRHLEDGSATTARRAWTALDPADPLGLLRWRRRAWIALKLIGGVGVLGAVAFGIARMWEWEWSWEGMASLGC